MKHFPIITFLLFFIILACTKNNEDQSSPMYENCSTLGRTVFYTSCDMPLGFIASTDAASWGNIISLYDRLAACEVPQTVLSKMTTEALAQSIAQYPLNYLIFAYNDPYSAVDFLVKNSSIHKEFIQREDNTHELIRLLSRATMKFDTKTNVSNTTPTLSYCDEMMLEYLMSSQEFSSRINIKDRDALADMILSKATERMADTLHYSKHSIAPLAYIDTANSLNIIHLEEPSTKSGEVVSHITLSTPLGKPIHGFTRNEHTAKEIIDMTNWITENYPNAIIRGSATAKYNCHSYAWYDNSTDNPYWINQNDRSNVFQLSNYWTNDVYVSSDEASANRAFYASGDHSAIILSNGNYLSKWGDYPVMEHSKEYCPYSTQSMQFFKPRTTSCYTLQVSGPTPVSMNQLNQYYVSPSFDGLDYSWEVRFMDAPEPKPFDFSTYDNYSTLICKDYGLFKINVYGKYNGNTVAYGQLSVIATP